MGVIVSPVYIRQATQTKYKEVIMKDYQKPLPKSALGLRNWGKYEKPMPFNIYVNKLDVTSKKGGNNK